MEQQITLTDAQRAHLLAYVRRKHPHNIILTITSITTILERKTQRSPRARQLIARQLARGFRREQLREDVNLEGADGKDAVGGPYSEPDVEDLDGKDAAGEYTGGDESTGVTSAGGGHHVSGGDPSLKDGGDEERGDEDGDNKEPISHDDLREFGQLVEQVGFIKSESRPQINEIERVCYTPPLLARANFTGSSQICKMATMMLHRLGY